MWNDMDILGPVASCITSAQRLLVHISKEIIVLRLRDVVQFLCLFGVHFLIILLNNYFLLGLSDGLLRTWWGCFLLLRGCLLVGFKSIALY